MGARSILARSFDKTDSVSRLSLGGDKTEITLSSQHTQTCVTPISLDDYSFLNVCHTVSLISPDRIVELVHLSEDERINGASSLSWNRRSVATIKTTVRPRGWLDRTEKTTKAALLVTELGNPPQSTEVAIPVRPQRDISLTFANESTIVIADGEQLTAFSLVWSFGIDQKTTPLIGHRSSNAKSGRSYLSIRKCSNVQENPKTLAKSLVKP